MDAPDIDGDLTKVLFTEQQIQDRLREMAAQIEADYAGRDILIARTTDDALAALDRSPEEIARLGRRARERVLAEHTSAHRVQDLLTAIEGARTALQPVAAEA